MLPIRRVSKLQDEYVIPGWNDFVDDRHKIAHEAFHCWVTAGKPRYGNEHMLMKRTRARFKLALRYCQQHENMLRAEKTADACVNSLADNDFRGFWKTVRNSNNAKATKFATSVGGCTGESNIAEMWHSHFKQLYNSVPDGGAKEEFYRCRAQSSADSYSTCSVTIQHVIDACNKQKTGKAAGPDGIAMEAFMHGGLRLQLHLTMLINMFLHTGYLHIFACTFLLAVNNNSACQKQDRRSC